MATDPDQLARIDARIDRERCYRDAADDACHEAERLFHETEIDRLLEVRFIVANGGLLGGLSETAECG